MSLASPSKLLCSFLKTFLIMKLIYAHGRKFFKKKKMLRRKQNLPIVPKSRTKKNYHVRGVFFFIFYSMHINFS